MGGERRQRGRHVYSLAVLAPSRGASRRNAGRSDRRPGPEPPQWSEATSEVVMALENQYEIPDAVGIPEELYLHASRWLQPVLDRVILFPIASQRYRALHTAIWQELASRARERGTTPKYELCREARQALALVIGGLNVPARLLDPCDPASPAAAEYVLGKIQARINDEVTQGLLGPGWRRRPNEDPLGESDAAVAPQEQPEANLIIARLLTDSRLSPRARDLLQAMRDHDGVIADAAHALGITSSTARTMLQRIRSKLTV